VVITSSDSMLDNPKDYYVNYNSWFEYMLCNPKNYDFMQKIIVQYKDYNTYKFCLQILQETLGTPDRHTSGGTQSGHNYLSSSILLHLVHLSPGLID
jgi:hypothetical protein